MTQCISNSQRIRADSARVDWSNAVQASSVQVPKNGGLVRSRSKNFSDWTWTRLDGSSPDWSIAGLVESLAKSAAQRWAREKEAKIGAGVWMRWTDGSRSDDGQVGATAVCKQGNEWRSRRIVLGTRHIEVFDPELQ